MIKIKHVKIKIYGKVQGVFFRASARKEAQELNVVGFAENLPDGSVYIEAEGEEDILKEFLEWCEIGPTQARVIKAVYEFSDKLQNYKAFTIK